MGVWSRHPPLSEPQSLFKGNVCRRVRQGVGGRGWGGFLCVGDKKRRRRLPVAAAAAAALLEGLWTRVFALGCTSTDAALRGPSARFLPYITALF